MNRTPWKLFPQKWVHPGNPSRRRRYLRGPLMQMSVERLEVRAVLSALSTGGEFLIAPDVIASPEELASGSSIAPQSRAISEDDFQSLLALGDAAVDTAAPSDVSSVRQEIVFIDEAVPESEALFRDLAGRNVRTHDVTVFRIDSRLDGVDQITRFLRSEQSWDAVHIISHGSGTGLQLGSTWLDADSAAGRAIQIESWREFLSDEADLFLYGCDVAGTARGRELLDTLRKLTGADIAASDDPTGAAELGGNWDVEYESGVVTTSIIVSAEFQQNWSHLLATLDWDAVDWVSESLSQSYTVSGGTLTFTLTGDTNRLLSGSPNDNTTTTGGLIPVQESVLIGVDYQAQTTIGDEAVTLTIDFSHSGGVSNVSFTIFDVDMGSWTDRVVVTADNGSTVNPSSVTVGSSVTFDGVNTVTGVSSNDSTSGNGNSTFTFNQSGISLVTITYASGRLSNPSSQIISLHDVSFSVGTPGITVTPTSGLTTTESGGTATFTVMLTSQPTADVTIGLSSNDTTEGTVSTAALTFTSANWNVAQTVTVTGVNDFLDDGDVSYTIITAAASSADANFNGLDAEDVAVTNIDNDAVGITVTPTSGLTTTEVGGTATFTVVLTSQPTGDVTVGLSSNDLTEGTVGTASLTFTSANWNSPQTVTVTGVDDFLDDGNVGYAIVTAAATSADAGYNGLNPSDASVSNTDNDAAGITISPTSGLTTTESGGTATFTLVLTSQPTADVTIGLSSSDTTEGTASPASLTFTSGNWNVAQTVTVTGADDFVDDGNIAYSIITAAATSADAGYNGLNPSDVSVSNTDNDAAGITVSPTSGLTTTEGGGTATFTVVLTSQPTADVAIGVSSSDTTEGTASPAMLTFTSGNWNVAQTVTISGVNDALDDGNVSYTIVTAAASSADASFNGLDPADVSVTNVDNDTAGFTVTPTSGLTTTEAGGTATFTVVLTSQPTADVVVGISSNDMTEGTVSPASLTFTAGNWNVAQIVTVTGVDDFVDDGNVAYTIVTAAASSGDAGYNGLDASDVSVSNTDNDTAGFTVSPTSGLTTTEDGGSASFTVVLTSQPTADVTIGLSSSDTTEGTVGPVSLTFTSADWNVAQTVTVTGVSDFLTDGDMAYSIVTAAATSSDASYNGLNASDVSATNQDGANDAPVNSTPGLQVTDVNTTLVFSSPNSNLISISDVDAGPNSVRVTLAAMNGTLTLSGTAGLTFTSGDGSDDASMTFDGSLVSINTALDGLRFAPTTSFSGPATVTVTTNDLGNSGSGGAMSDVDSISIQVGAARFQEGINGYVGTEDTELRSDEPATGHGKATSITVDLDDGGGTTQGLIQFENIFGNGAGQIPLGSTIVSASLRVYVVDTTGSSTQVTLNRMLVNWDEASTWNSLTNGVQLNNVEAASAVDSTLANPNASGFQSFDGLAATVQAWSSGAANHGWVITIDSQNGWDFNTSEFATDNRRPTLIVTFTIPQSSNLDLDADNSSGAAGSDYVTSFTEDGGAVSVTDVDATIADADSANLTSLTVTINNLLDGAAESLAANTSGTSIVGSYDSGTGILTLTGSDTVANYQQVLRTITYNNSSQNPNTSSRLVTFVSTDDFSTSNTATATLSVTRTNDVPVNSFPVAPTTAEDSPLVFSAGNLISISDVDAGFGSMQVTLTGTNGVVTLSTATGLTFSTGDGSADATMTFAGNVTDVNASLDGLRFLPNANFFGSATLTITTNDQGNTGAGGAKSDSDLITVIVSETNDAPVAVNDSASTNEDTSVSGNVLANDSDPDNTDGLAGNDDTLTASLVSGPTNGGLVLNADGSFTYTPSGNWFGTDSFTYRAVDSDGAPSNIATVTITVSDVNDAPVVQVPGAQQTPEDTPLVFAVSLSNEITVFDVEVGSGIMEITLTAINGRLTLTQPNWLLFSTGDGIDDQAMTFTGTVADINAALDGVRFTPDANFNGLAVVMVTANDMGATGAGGPQATSRNVLIDVVAVNDAPQITWPGPQVTEEDVGLTFSVAGGNAVRVDDLDAGSNPIEVTLTVTSGSLTLADSVGLTFTTGDGTTDPALTFSGTVANINAALDGLRFTPESDFHGTSVMTLVVNDQGNSGGGGSNTITQVGTITVTSVLDPGEIGELDPPPSGTGGPGGIVNGIAPSGAVPGSDTGGDGGGTGPDRDWPLSFGGGTVVEEEPEVTPSETPPPPEPPPMPEVPQPTVIEVKPPVTPVVETVAMVPETIRRPPVSLGWITLDSVDVRQGSTEAILKHAGWLGSGVTSMALAGYVGWNLNYSWLAAGALAARPLWRQFDPLVILEMWELSRKKTDDEEESIRGLFG